MKTALFLIFCCVLQVFCASYQDNIIIIFDASGSMSGRMKGGVKMDVAKNALISVLSDVPQTTDIGLLVFSASNCKDWLYQPGEKDPQKLSDAIRLPIPHGNTPLGQYMKKGADRLLERRKEQNGYGTFRLLIVTDGEATDADLVKKYLPDILSRGITVDVIGVDMDNNHVLARSAHSYRTADDPETLKKAISSVFAEIGSSTDTQIMDAAFADLSPLPVEIASGIIKGLSESGNQPIGTVEQSRPQDSQVKKTQPDSRAESKTKPGKTSKTKKTKFNPFAVIILAIVIASLIRRK